jgi:hypothetical protein
MELYKQTDSRWKNIQLGTCPDETIGSAGCFITVLGMLANMTPPEVNTALIQGRGYAQGCLVIFNRAAALLGLLEEGRGATVKRYPCIAWTDHFKGSGIPQHFFVCLNDTEIIDPLSGARKKNPYRIKEYVHIYPKETLNMEEKQELQNLRSFKQQVQGGIKYMVRVSDNPDVMMMYHIPSLEHFNALGLSMDNVIGLPDWGSDPNRSIRVNLAAEEILALRNTLQQTQGANAQLVTQINDVKEDLMLAEVDVDGLNKELETVRAELAITKKVLEDESGIVAAPEGPEVMHVDAFLIEQPAISLIKALISKLFGK